MSIFTAFTKNNLAVFSRFSYFYESFESYCTVNDLRNSVIVLKYMLLCKIMSNETGDVHSIVHGKAGVKFAGIEVEALLAVANAHKKRSLKSFEQVLHKYPAQLGNDPMIASHIHDLYEKLLEQNLIRILDPFSVVEIGHVAKLIDLPVDRIQTKLSEMILDGKFNGILDQGAGNLIVYDAVEEDATYEAGIQTMKELNIVTDCLYDKARRLTHQ
uniref:PCI domain-containing protein n=1 Tax=Spongospora subterranea TaxID=70186 RepID=A0A0H5QH75_9EUKA|eukprot:CRZ01007.1 hypothetical protein [Spongospora subterranea]